jgi:hypothetical protein
MSIFIATMITAPVVALSVPQLQAWFEAWDYTRHVND